MSSCFNIRRRSNLNRKKRYDVYFSFCDEDARSFVLGIYKGLTSSEREIVVFWDDNKRRIRRGGEREIPTSVLNVIQDCKLVVIVFSTNYFNSRWCLQELEKITECCRTTDSSLMLLTLFYDRVVGIRISFGISEKSIAMFEQETFHEFLDRISKQEIFQHGDKFMSWVATISHNKAMTYAGSTYLGHVFTYKSKSEHIENVVELATHVITGKRGMFNGLYTESLNSRVQDVIQLLKQSKSPLILGIWGMSGIGKTTIAKAIYGQVGSYFAHKCLIENVKRSVQNKSETLVSLQEKILFDMARAPEINISTIESGKVILKERLRGKRVLLVLDDVDNLEQLNALCGSHEWFGEGSKIIITTRDRKLLKEHGADHIYRVKELDENESLELFNWNAFSQATSHEGFADLSRQVVAYSGGLPLALTDLGKHFNSKKVATWESKLRYFTSYHYNGVQGTLESSLNDLNDEEKQIFFDLAYFYIGIDQHDVQSLNSSTQCTNLLISLLEDKSFVTIDENNKIQMHVLHKATAEAIITRESSNNTDQPKMYDVFLSFRGEDSRAKFMSHLHSSFQNAGIDSFRDDDKIQRGDQISISLLQAIGRSRLAIVVFSKNYANSRWCLLELEKIMEIGRDRGLVVVPVFYEVDPSDVRHQKGHFGKVFDDLISKNSVDESTKSRWQRDLYEICGIAGFVLIDSRNESADIKNIVEHVTRLLDRTQLFVAEHPVGVESRVESVTKLLNIEKSEDVLLLGIWGMGGTGKSTISKAIYNKIGKEFEGRSFLLGIREIWKTHTNQVSLQQQVLCDVYKTTALKIRDIESGKHILKEKLSKNRVLFVLDDVDELDQLKALCGSREWFGPGSRVIITTRDMDLLRSCGVNQVYTIEEMDESESLELFSWHAFKQPSPTEDYATHSADVIAYSGRLPLALEVIGSYLSNCEITEWQKVLEKLKCIPHDQVQKKLKVSFDGLKDFTEKQIFLDIACFFIGMDKKDVMEILNGCGFFADIGIKVLVERALLTIDNRNKLRMHDLLRDMGRQIIFEESPSDPEKRSRVWRCDEVLDILSKDKGTEVVKGLALEFPRKDCLETKAFKKMNKLRLLRLAGVKLEGDFKYLSGDLRWLYWHGFPLTYIPAEFQQGSLVAIELKYSMLKQIWNKSQTADGTWDSFLLGCDNKSDWLTFSCKGCSIIFDVPTMKESTLNSMMLSVAYYSCSDNITSEGCQGVLIINYTKTTIHAYKRDTLTSFEDEDWQSITSNLEPGNKVEVVVVFGEGFIVDKTTVSLLYDESLDKEMEHCHVVDKEDVIVSCNGGNNVSVSGGDNEAINRFGDETVNHMQTTRHADGLYADVVEPVQLVTHDSDQLAEAAVEEIPAEAAVEEIPAAETYGDQEQQVPLPECQPEQQATSEPEAIGMALGAHMLDALRELTANFFQLEQTVAARLNAVEVRLEVLEDVMAQIPRWSNSESKHVES
ncbi:unnamed protein product [Trifolium pratense]|uniref:Uncharacterized protein n=1 Tax=Trifolium pratense TaxID=57577 RepID=A0ACB0KEQ5_TRIPR|nr:unnamed protein product [Trifolium pratense]